MELHKTVIHVVLPIGLFFGLPVWGQEKPLTQDRVQEDVLFLKRYPQGIDPAIQQLQRVGTDFAPTARFLRFLEAAGARETYLEALQTAKHPQTTNEPVAKPLDQTRIITLLAGQVPSQRVAILIRERGIDFEPKGDYLEQVRLAGGDEELVSALKTAKVTTEEAEVQQYLARGTILIREEHSFDAEDEFGAALHLEPGNLEAAHDLRDAFKKNIYLDWEIAEEYDALRLNPNDECAHVVLGQAKYVKEDLDGALSEFQETLRINPSNCAAHFDLGWIIMKRGNYDAAIPEFREGLRLKPNDKVVREYTEYGLMWVFFHHEIGKVNLDGPIALYRDLLRLDPDNFNAHSYLAGFLGEKGDYDGEIAEYREVLRLNGHHHHHRRLLFPRQIAWAEEKVQIKDYGEARQITLFEHGQVVLQILTSDLQACPADICPC